MRISSRSLFVALAFLSFVLVVLFQERSILLATPASFNSIQQTTVQIGASMMSTMSSGLIGATIFSTDDNGGDSSKNTTASTSSWSISSKEVANEKSRTSTAKIPRVNVVGRTFVRYESSSWEQEWLSVIDEIDVDPFRIRAPICEKIKHDSDKVRRYLHATCNRFPINATANIPWCIIDDSYRPIYFNTQTGRAAGESHIRKYLPGAATLFEERKPRPILDTDADLFSRFVYKGTDKTSGKQTEYFEYIEPLVGFLRHPLTCCESVYNYSAIEFEILPKPHKPSCFGYLRTSRTQYVAPAPTLQRRTISNGFDEAEGAMPPSTKYYYFDAGASDWTGGRGGPSLNFFYDLYKLQGILFDKMFAYEASTTHAEFNATLPQEHVNLVEYHQTSVRSQVNDSQFPGGPFLPHVIQSKAKKEDYVFFKLDIDSPGVEEGNVEYLMDPKNDILDYIDEFYYEFHTSNPGRRKWTSTISEWYKNFLWMRQKGVRAHSWI